MSKVLLVDGEPNNFKISFLFDWLTVSFSCFLFDSRHYANTVWLQMRIYTKSYKIGTWEARHYDIVQRYLNYSTAIIYHYSYWIVTLQVRNVSLTAHVYIYQTAQ